MIKNLLEKVKKDKKLLLLIVVAVVIVYFGLFQQKPKKKPKPKKETVETVKPKKEEYISVLLEEQKKKEKESEKVAARTLIVEKRPPKVKQKPKPKPKKRPKFVTQSEKVRSIYDVYYSPVKDLTLKAELVEEAEEEPLATEEVVPESEKEETEPEKVRKEILLPGTILRATLLTNLIAPEGLPMHFVTKIESASGPTDLTFENCYGVGRAILNSRTHRVEAQLLSVACPDKFMNVEAVAVSEDLKPGLEAEYHSKIGRRLAASFFEAFLPTYARAKAEAEEARSSRVTQDGSTIVTDFKIQNPEKYAFYSALASWGDSLRAEIERYKYEQSPVAYVTALTPVWFFVQYPAEVVFLTE